MLRLQQQKGNLLSFISAITSQIEKQAAVKAHGTHAETLGFDFAIIRQLFICTFNAGFLLVIQ